MARARGGARVSSPRWYPLPDDQAQMFGEAVMGLGRAAIALPLDALRAWLDTERKALLLGEQGVTGADPRRIEQLMMICDALNLAAMRTRGFDVLMDELEVEAAAQKAADEQAAREAAAAQRRADEEAEREEAASQQQYGDRRDEPIPDDWAV